MYPVMKDVNKRKRLFRLLIIVLISGTLVSAGLLLIIPIDYRPEESSDTIKAEIISRIEDIAEKRGQLTLISFTPFMWDEGYLIDITESEDKVEEIISRSIEYKQLSENEQRLVFYYKGQIIVDLVIGKDEINFDIMSGQLKKDEWINIDNSSDIIRLYN